MKQKIQAEEDEQSDEHESQMADEQQTVPELQY